MKQLILQSDIDDKIITTTKTKWKDVISPTEFVLAVGRNSGATYMIRWRGGAVSLESPEFWGAGGDKFPALWETQQFYDLYTFGSLAEIETFIEEEGLAWGKGGN